LVGFGSIFGSGIGSGFDRANGSGCVGMSKIFNWLIVLII
jgi:hypothetical protein